MRRVESEQFSPDPERLALVQRCVEVLQPDDAALGDWTRAYAVKQRNRLALDLEIVERYVPKSSVITEFGSIPLILTAALHQLGYAVRGIDIDPGRFSRAISSLGLEVLKCDIETESLPLPDDCSDVVIFNELFEHLRINPIFTFREVHRILKRDGVLLLSTPNLRSLRGLVNFLVKNRAHSCTGNVFAEYSKLEQLGHMGHVREYTTKEVIEFLANVGFRVESMVFRGSYPRMLSHTVTRVLPRLRPFVTYVARAT